MAERTVFRIRALLSLVRMQAIAVDEDDSHRRLAIVHGLVRGFTWFLGFAHFEGTDASDGAEHSREPVVVGCCDGHSSSDERITKRRTGDD